MSGKSLYETLQVHPDASPEVIKAAYKSLSTKYHPDRDKSADAARRFAEIQKAFDVLSDPDRRRRYDANPAQGTAASSGSSVVFRLDGTSTFLTLEEHQRRGWKEAASCDLSNQDFSGVSFKDAKLTKARLDGSRFNGCDVRGADLTNCSAKDCQFDRANFAGAKLMRTDFSRSRIRAAKFFCVGPVWVSGCTSSADRFTESDSDRKKISTAETEEAVAVVGHSNFSNCDLAGAVFAAQPAVTNQQTRTQQSTFGTAREVPVWTKHYFWGCGIKDCDFAGANLNDCDLRSIDLSGSEFLRANLQRAQMQGCNVGSVDLASCNLVDTNLTGCIVDDATKFPEGYAIPNGVKNRDEEIRLQAKKNREDTRKAVYVILSLILSVAAVLLIFYLTRPEFFIRPPEGVTVSGPFAAWYNGTSKQESVILEITGLSNSTTLTASDLSIGISHRVDDKNSPISFWLSDVCHQGRSSAGGFWFLTQEDFTTKGDGQYVNLGLGAPIVVFENRAQIKFSMLPKETGVFTLRVASETLNAEAFLAVDTTRRTSDKPGPQQK